MVAWIAHMAKTILLVLGLLRLPHILIVVIVIVVVIVVHAVTFHFTLRYL